MIHISGQIIYKFHLFITRHMESDSLEFLENTLTRQILIYCTPLNNFYIYLEYDLLTQLHKIGAFLLDFMLKKLSNILNISLGIVKLFRYRVESSANKIKTNMIYIYYGTVMINVYIYRYKSLTSWLSAVLPLLGCMQLLLPPTLQSVGSRLRQRFLMPLPPVSTAHSLEAFDPPELSVDSMFKV